MVQDYDRLKKVRVPKHKKNKSGKTNKQYNAVEIAKAAATAKGKEVTTASTDAESGVPEAQNRAVKTEVSDKRKADELVKTEGGMDVDQAGDVEGTDEARAAKQQRV